MPITLTADIERRIDVVLTDRSHKAVAINLDGRKVLTLDLDILHGEGSRYEAGSKAAIIRHSNNPRYDGQRRHFRLGCGYQTAVDGVFYLSEEMVGITSNDWWSDYTEFAAFANAPALEPGDRCAILCFSKRRNYTEVHTVVFEKSMRFTEQSEEDTMPSINQVLRS